MPRTVSQERQAREVALGHIKLWDDMLDCEKVDDLSDLAFRCWIKLLCNALRNGGRNGELPSLKTIAYRNRMSTDQVEVCIKEMHQCGLLEACPENPIGGMPYKIHDWDHWQTSKDSAGALRQARWRERQALRNASRNGLHNATCDAQRDAVEGKKVEVIPPISPKGGKNRKPYGDVFRAGRPAWAPEQDWEAYIEARRKKRGIDSALALQQVLDELARLKTEGTDPLDSIRQSARGTWSDVYEVRRRGGKPTKHPTSQQTALTDDEIDRKKKSDRANDARRQAEFDRLQAAKSKPAPALAPPPPTVAPVDTRTPEQRKADYYASIKAEGNP